MGRRSAPFSTDLTRLKVVANTDRVGSTITCCIGWCNIVTLVICPCAVGVSHVYVLITAEKASTLAQIVDSTYREAISLASSCAIDAACLSVGHAALSHQGCVAPPVLATRVPDVSVGAGIHCRITLSCAARTVKWICRQGSGSSTGCRTNSVVDVFILTAELEVLERPGSTNPPYLFRFETYALLELIGIIPGVTTEYIKPHTHKVGMVLGSSLTVEIAIPAAGIALAAQATREKAL